MPRVLRIINRFNLGGPTYNAAYLTKYLEPEFETLLVGGPNEESEESSQFILQNLGVEPLIIDEMQRSVSYGPDRAAYKKLKAIIEDFKPDIVHTHASKAGALGRLAAHKMKVPAIVHTFHGHVFHSYFGAAKTQTYKTVERYLARKTDRIIAISERQQQELVDEHRICESDRVQVIPLGFDLKRFRENMEEKRKDFRAQYGLEDDDIAVGIIGRLVPIKNHALFIDAMKIVSERSNRKVKAFIIGDGEERESLNQLASQEGLLNGAAVNCSITFTSWIKEIDKANAGLDIVVLTSKNEGTPVSLIEAQAASKPIVSTRVGGVENIVIPNETAFLTDEHDAEQIAIAILKLTESDETRQRMADKGWDHVKYKFSYDRLVDDTAKLYRELLR